METKKISHTNSTLPTCRCAGLLPLTCTVYCTLMFHLSSCGWKLDAKRNKWERIISIQCWMLTGEWKSYLKFSLYCSVADLHTHLSYTVVEPHWNPLDLDLYLDLHQTREICPLKMPDQDPYIIPWEIGENVKNYFVSHCKRKWENSLSETEWVHSSSMSHVPLTNK